MSKLSSTVSNEVLCVRFLLGVLQFWFRSTSIVLLTQDQEDFPVNIDVKTQNMRLWAKRLTWRGCWWNIYITCVRIFRTKYRSTGQAVGMHLFFMPHSASGFSKHFVTKSAHIAVCETWTGNWAVSTVKLALKSLMFSFGFLARESNSALNIDTFQSWGFPFHWCGAFLNRCTYFSWCDPFNGWCLFGCSLLIIRDNSSPLTWGVIKV